MARTEARRQARIRYAMKHKAKTKPLAPVEWYSKIDKEHWWKWLGEEIESKGLGTGSIYSTAELRHKGYKVPPLPKEAKKCKSKK